MRMTSPAGTYARNRSITAAVSSGCSSCGRSPACSIVIRSRWPFAATSVSAAAGSVKRGCPEEEECRVREPPVGGLRSRIVEQPGDEGERSTVGVRLLAGPPAVPLVLPWDLLRIREGLPKEPADHLAPSEDREEQPADPRPAQEPVDGPGGSASVALEAAESRRTDQDDPAEPLRMLRSGNDDILPRQRKCDDIDGGLARLQRGQPDALELLAEESPAVGRVGPIRRAESEPVDEHDPPMLGQPRRQRRELDPRTSRIEAVQEQDRPTLAELVGGDPAGGGLDVERDTRDGRGRGCVMPVP